MKVEDNNFIMDNDELIDITKEKDPNENYKTNT